MTAEQLQQTLTALHDELSRVASVDDATRQKLLDVTGDIQRLVGSTEPAPGRPGTVESPVIETLQDAVSHFEARHPQLTASVQQIIDRLAEMGI